MPRIEYLVARRHRRWARELLKIYGVDIQPGAAIGDRLRLQHGGHGLVVHANTTIGDDVVIYQQVTIGRSSYHRSADDDGFEGLRVGNHAVLCAGAKVLGGSGTLCIGEGTVIGANAVLLESTGVGEVWAGAPARRVARRAGWFDEATNQWLPESSRAP